MTKELVKKLKTIHGYLAFSISTSEGKIVGADIKNMNIEKKEMATLLKEYNSIFSRVHKNADVLEIGAIEDVVFELENASILLIASKSKKDRLYFFTILSKEGNINLVKTLVNSYVDLVTEDILKNYKH